MKTYCHVDSLNGIYSGHFSHFQCEMAGKDGEDIDGDTKIPSKLFGFFVFLSGHARLRLRSS